VTQDLAAQLDSVRLESDTLYGVISVIASSPDLDRVLDGIVELLTTATRCHACFVYLRAGERLVLRAASPVYAQHVGSLSFGVDEGLAGWAVRQNRPAFIREDALKDPRTNHVPELEEERFQSVIAVPTPSRSGEAMGVIVLHTIAPREFDAGTVNMLVHTAPLVAGVIENAQLYAQAQRRVSALTTLAEVSQRIAATDRREDLYRVATTAARALVGCGEARLYEMDPDRGRLQLVAIDPPLTGPAATPPPRATAVLLELAQQRETSGGVPASGLRDALDLDPDASHVAVLPVSGGEEHLGVLVAASREPLADDAGELLRSVANQIAVALKKAELIERLTEENVVNDLFDALERGRVDDAAERARTARYELDRAHVFVHVVRARDGRDGDSWPSLVERTEAALRRLAAGTLCDADNERVRALVPFGSGGTDWELGTLDAALTELGADAAMAIGRSDVHRGIAGGRAGLREAADAARITRAMVDGGGSLAYGTLGAYRYLVHVTPDDSARDPYLQAVRAIDEYDARRGGQLLQTLEQHLAERRNIARTARALTVHPNTLRQRLQRIEKLTGLDLATADLLALQLAIKLNRLRPAEHPDMEAGD
jgi:GAF domain-containing protein